MTVSALLSQARDAHRQYRAKSGRISKDGKIAESPNLWQCGEYVRTALKLRAEADALDPTHSDDGWREDMAAMKGQSNDALMQFYAGYLGR